MKKTWTFRLVMVVMALLLITPATMVFALKDASPPQPAYLETETMTVDGNTADWNMDASDFFAEMRRAGLAGKPLEANAYLRYDCETETMYVLVLSAGDWPVLTELYNTWVAIDGISNKVTFTAFAWVDQGYDGNSTHTRGWEASFVIAPGSYKITVHTNVYDDGGSQTASSVPKIEGTDLIIQCYDPSAVTLASFGAAARGNAVQLNWETASEEGNVGFNLYRADAPQRAPARLNEGLILSKALGSASGASYAFVDGAIRPGVTYYYWLEAVDVSGGTERFGPVSARVTSFFGKVTVVRPRFSLQSPLSGK